MGIFDRFKKRVEVVQDPEEPPKQWVDATRFEALKRQLNARDAIANHGSLGVRRFLTGSNTINSTSLLGTGEYPHHDIDFIQHASRREYVRSPELRSIIGRLNTNVINTGLSLEASPLFDLLGIESEDQRTQWTTKVENLWKLWADSLDVDVRGNNSFNLLQKELYLSLLRDGEFFLILRYTNSSRLFNSLQVQTVSPTQVSTPFGNSKLISEVKSRGNRIVQGIEFDPSGKEVAFFIFDHKVDDWVRVPKFGGRLNRQFVIHGYTREFPSQVRGFPIATGMFEELSKLTNYSVAELAAAVLNASLAVWVKPSDDRSASNPLQQVARRVDPKAEAQAEIVSSPIRNGVISDPGIGIFNLKAGEEIHSFDTKRPNVNHEVFTRSIKKSLGASISIPIEILDMEFGSNFSASRAALSLFWNVIETRRHDFATQLLNPVYEMFLQDLISRQTIISPGFLNNPVSRAAWLNARWVGIPKPTIDPFKEARAVTERINQGVTTREIESRQYNGTSFDENINRLNQENEKLGDAFSFQDDQNESTEGDDNERNTGDD